MRTNRPGTIGICLLLLSSLAACELPPADATPTPEVTVTPVSTQAPLPTPTAEPGTVENPILLALPPTQFTDPVVVANGQKLAGMIAEKTGYRVVAVAPTSMTELIEALRTGNAHIAVLPMFAIVKAYQEKAVAAAFASTHDGAASYGAQFVAPSGKFTSYYDAGQGVNTSDAPEALAQFSGKKPCWTEPESPSGYLVPDGIFNWYQIPIQEGAFLQSHYSVVRAVRMGEVCDFGATYIDARTYPALKEEYPFIMDEVMVAWQIPPIIPYDGIFFSSRLPLKMQNRLKNEMAVIFASENGRLLFETLFGIQGMLQVDDILYVEFTRYIEASGVDVNTLIH